MNKYIILLGIVIGLIFYSQAQEREGRKFRIQLEEKLVFEKIMDFALTKDFFISSLNKDENFIQIIRFKKKKGSLVSNGERLTYNFIIRKASEKESILNLQIRVEDDLYKNYVNFYVDRGITKDISYYNSIINELNLVRSKREE